MVAAAEEPENEKAQQQRQRLLDESLNFAATELRTVQDSGQYIPDGAAFELDNANIKLQRELLQRENDTTDMSTTEHFLRVAQELGFRPMLVEAYEVDHYENGELTTEQLQILFEETRGIMLSFNTYEGRLDGVQARFNWRPTEDEWHEVIFFGGPKAKQDDSVLVGCLDLHGALRTSIRQLEENGEFVTPWLQVDDSPWIVTPLEVEAHPIPSGGRLWEISRQRMDSITDAAFRRVVFGETES